MLNLCKRKVDHFDVMHNSSTQIAQTCSNSDFLLDTHCSVATMSVVDTFALRSLGP